MKPLVTVILPTHDHGDLLRYSISTVLAQTIPDFELFIIGDGVPETARELISTYVAQDPRIRFFDHPKGERCGEHYRHLALGEASGDIVCYLSDDDLWLPSHLESMLSLLSDCDFANCVPATIDPGGKLGIHTGDLALPECRRSLLEGTNFIPLSSAAHTLSLYRRLPYGWRPAPPGIFSDLYMWQQILGVEPLRALSGTRCTLLNFPSPSRRGVSLCNRGEELAGWMERVFTPGFEAHLSREVLGLLIKRGVEIESALRHTQIECRSLQESRARISVELTATREESRFHRTELTALREQRTAIESALAQVSAECIKQAEQIAAFKRLINSVESGITWRLRKRVLGIPFFGRMLKQRGKG